MHTWGSKRRRLAKLEQIVAARVEMRDRHGALIDSTVEDLYYMAKYGNGGQMEFDHPSGTFTFTT